MLKQAVFTALMQQKTTRQRSWLIVLCVLIMICKIFIYPGEPGLLSAPMIVFYIISVLLIITMPWVKPVKVTDFEVGYRLKADLDHAETESKLNNQKINVLNKEIIALDELGQGDELIKKIANKKQEVIVLKQKKLENTSDQIVILDTLETIVIEKPKIEYGIITILKKEMTKLEREIEIGANELSDLVVRFEIAL
jgi:hypothetical protein